MISGVSPESLYKALGVVCESAERLPASGSARCYYRLRFPDRHTLIATVHADLAENRQFLYYSAHFRTKGLPVPAIHAVSGDQQIYLQDDLGDVTLLDEVMRLRRQTGEAFPQAAVGLYRRALDHLLQFQLQGDEGLDYSRAIPRPVFDATAIRWDLNYFKYDFLRLAAIPLDEQRLEEDFERLTGVLTEVPAESFMFRDFQSRNIMLHRDALWFIDYQGGRRGALHYDVASLLYDAIVEVPDPVREALLDYYMERLASCRAVDPVVFRREYYQFVLVRLLQALGAFGLRGLYERKQHFIDSVPPALKTLNKLMNQCGLSDIYPEIFRVLAFAAKRFE